MASSSGGAGHGGPSEAALPPPPPSVPPGTVTSRVPGDGEGQGKGKSIASSAGRSRGPSNDMAVLPARASRPGFGRIGQPTRLLANHFRANLEKRDEVYQYSVTIEPPVTNKKVGRDIMRKLRETFVEAECGGKRGAYDGEHTLYTSRSLNFVTMSFPVFLDDHKGTSFKPGAAGKPGESPSPPQDIPGGEIVTKRRKTIPRGRDFVVTFRLAGTINMGAIEEMMRGAMGRCSAEQEKRALIALRVLDTMLRECASERRYLLVRDNFFHSSLGPNCELGEGVEGWRGYHSSIRPTGMGLTLNLDITMTAVLKPVLVEEFLMDKFRVKDLRNFRARDCREANAVLKGVQIETTHLQPSRTHKIKGFSDKRARDLKFQKRIKDNEGNFREEEVSVEAYYFEVYTYELKYPDLPALDVGNKKRNVFIPIELCKIVAGQRYKLPLSSMQRDNQIGACKHHPREREKLCNEAMRISNYNSDELVKDFGLRFEKRMAPVLGRKLPAPMLQFGNERTEQPRNGRWNFSNKRVCRGVKITRWAVVVFDDHCYDGARIGRDLMLACNRQGMDMAEPKMVEEEPRGAQNQPPEKRVERMFEALKAGLKVEQPEFLLAILPKDNSNAAVYVAFKRYCEMRIGHIASQCMKRIPSKLNPQYYGNLALKINLKMGGLNSPLTPRMTTCLGPSTIIFGMDVSHGSAREDTPSIAAVVATKNWPDVFQYSTRARTQPAKVEMIEDLQKMVKDLIGEYINTYNGPRDGRFPTQIIVYRDGLSESQFAECLEKEVLAFKRACRDIHSNYNPGITFITAQKRHNTRFFPQDDRDAMPKNGNVIPGTVVDKDVCHPHNFDFFLVSQAGLIGTSRPTHYHVLVNENKLDPDDIQGLTNNLCYTFGRCCTSISMAAPAAYAHFLAKRYRLYVNSLGGSDASSLRSGRAGEAPKRIEPLPQLRLQPRYSMFFC